MKTDSKFQKVECIISRYKNKKPKSTIKKIRGWKRRLKKVIKNGGNIYYPNLEYYSKNGREDCQCDNICPRIISYEKELPKWYFRKIIKYFVIAFGNWDRIFKELNEPYDLQLRLYDPHNFHSEIWCKRMENNGDKYYWWPLSDSQNSFPFHKFNDKGYDLSIFDWELCIEEDILFESEFELRETNEHALLKKGYDKRENDYGVYFAKRVGDVWIGRKKNPV